jgi:hypothetical protein
MCHCAILFPPNILIRRWLANLQFSLSAFYQLNSPIDHQTQTNARYCRLFLTKQLGLAVHPLPDDAHNFAKSLEGKTLHNVSFALTASVLDGAILDFSINKFCSRTMPGTGLNSELPISVFSRA